MRYPITFSTEFASKFKPSKATIRSLLNVYHESRRFATEHWPHILIVLLTIYLLTSLSFTTVETFQNRKEKTNEIVLPLKYDRYTDQFTTLITFYENNKKTPIKLHLNLSTIYTSIVESQVTYCVTPHARYHEIPCNEKCHTIYGAKCNQSKFPLTDKLSVDKKLLKVIKTCASGQKIDKMCGKVYDNNHSRWVKIYETQSKIQLGDKIFHNKVFIDIINKLFTTKDVNRNWNILGLGYPTQNDKVSILKQLNIKMFTITDNPDQNSSKLILNPKFEYFKDPDTRTSFFAEKGKRTHLLNSMSIETPNKSSTQRDSLNYINSFPIGYVGKIELTTSETELLVNHQMKVNLLEIFRILNLLTREEDDNAFTHYGKPLVINNTPELFPILKFSFRSPNSQTPETITLRPRNYIKQLIPEKNQAITHFVTKPSRTNYHQQTDQTKNIVFGLPFFKYRAVTFNDETTTMFVKEIDLHPPHSQGSKLHSLPPFQHSQQSQHSQSQHSSKPLIPKAKTSIYPKKMVRKVKRRRPVNIQINHA